MFTADSGSGVNSIVAPANTSPRKWNGPSAVRRRRDLLSACRGGPVTAGVHDHERTSEGRLACSDIGLGEHHY